MLSKNYKNLYALIWHFWSPKGRKQQFEKPVNAGWKPTSKECDHKVNQVLFLIALSQHQQHQRL